MTSDPAPSVRAAAAHALAPGKSISQALESALTDEHAEVRLAAAHTIGKKGQPGFKLLTSYTDHALEGVRVAAYRGLATAPKTQRVPLLLPALADNDAAIRAAAARSLSECDTAAESLVGVLRTDGAADVRIAAIESISTLAGDHTSALVGALTDTSARVRTACLDALTRLGYTPGDDDIAASIAIARDDWTGLARIGKAGVKTIEGFCEISKNEHVKRRLGALTALQHIALSPTGTVDAATVAQLTASALNDSSPAVRALASRVLSHVDRDAAIALPLRSSGC